MRNTFIATNRMAWISGMVLLAACAAPAMAPNASSDATPAAGPTPKAVISPPVTGTITSAHPLPMPPTRPIAQPEGTPLPPKDAAIANTWPPEFKQLIDNMITLLNSTPDTAPDIEEVRRRFGITLTEEKLSASQQKNWGRRYTVDQIRYGEPKESIAFRSYYAISNPEGDSNGRSQTLRLQMGPALSGFCLNPYDLAVYTGWKFSNFDTSPHTNIRRWPPAYVWGMFTWSNTGRYGGPGYNILVSLVEDSAGKIVGVDCVSSITVSARYPKEK